MNKDKMIKVLFGVLCFMSMTFAYGCFYMYSSMQTQNDAIKVTEAKPVVVQTAEILPQKTVSKSFQIVSDAHASEDITHFKTEKEAATAVVTESTEEILKTENEEFLKKEDKKTTEKNEELEQKDPYDVSNFSTIGVDGQNEDFIVVKKSTFMKLKDERDFLNEKNLLLAKQQIKDKEYYEQTLRDKELELEKRLTVMTNDFNKKLEMASNDKSKLMSFIKKQDKYISELRDNLKVSEQEYTLLLQNVSEKNKILNSKVPSLTEVSGITVNILKVDTEKMPEKKLEEKAEDKKVVLQNKKEKQQQNINPLAKYKLTGISTDFITLENKNTGREYSLIIGEKISGVALKKINTKNGTVTFANGYVMSIR